MRSTTRSGIIAGYSEALLDRAARPALSAHDGLRGFPRVSQNDPQRDLPLQDHPEEPARIRAALGRAPSARSTSTSSSRKCSSCSSTGPRGSSTPSSSTWTARSRRSTRTPGSLQAAADEPAPERHLLHARGREHLHQDRAGRCPRERRASGGCPHRVRLSVRDTGAGIPADLIDKIFDPFFTTKPVGEGTGLGLTISHKIVEEHGGSIDVKSEPGKGATFIITLPSIGCRE